ncbi:MULTISPECIES: hypothetical protein [Pseudanabaena]|jgi:hypothetical protein|uniref:hypothetical protein n=1 Tax=Pseudanabaena TaxID=1152 RepID=UPI00247B1603|nr:MULTISPECIES: hypothetical protein [Pseudanabaena]MEA5488507.1 hypothetical protein [Pseudanabaena sp. CCNP1317]WGS71907.1 hypothetical protein OA858_19725 [Pseudanabaena galeata CCNP1313]
MFEVASILFNLHLSTASNINGSHLAKFSSPVRIAHEVKTSQGVGGTIHIEPNDRPVAGKKSRIWIALTRRGGELIPYGKCNCRLEVRSLTDRNIKFTVANPLSIIERYLGLPSMEVIFPQVGRYELHLSGSPTEGADFSPFELTFTTNVGR